MVHCAGWRCPASGEPRLSCQYGYCVAGLTPRPARVWRTTVRCGPTPRQTGAGRHGSAPSPQDGSSGARSQTFPCMHLARGLTIQLLLGIAFEARLRTVAEQHEPCMPPLSSASLAYVLSGFGVGILVGMTGVGGGSLMTGRGARIRDAGAVTPTLSWFR